MGTNGIDRQNCQSKIICGKNNGEESNRSQNSDERPSGSAKNVSAEPSEGYETKIVDKNELIN